MKKFLRRFSVYLFQFFLIPALLFILFSYQAKEQIHSFKIDSSVNKIVLGDSRPQLTINDTVTRGLKNMSLGSESFIFSCYKLQSILKNNQQIDTVFLGASYHSFSGYYEEFTFFIDVAARYFFTLPAGAQLFTMREVKNAFVLVLKSIKVTYQNVYENKKKLSYEGGFETYVTKLPLSCESIEHRVNVQFFKNDKLHDIYGPNVEHFIKIKQLCEAYNVKLILLNTPVHPDYEESVPQKFKDFFNSFVHEQGVQVIDFKGLQLRDVDFLPDGDHLTEAGAYKASRYFQRVIDKSGN